MQFLTLSLRGLLRNRRRSLANLLAIALGFAAIALFAGYTHNIYRGLANQAIHGELLGHLTIAKRGMSREGKLYPERYLLSREEVLRITALVKEERHVALVTPRLTLSGIVSNGRASTIFVAEGVDPTAAKALQAGLLVWDNGDPKNEPTMIGTQALDATKPDTITLAQGLAELLRLKQGDRASLLSNTVSGQANAVDVVVGDRFKSGSAATDDLYAFMPLALARSLYDAEGRADRLTVLLEGADQTDAMRADLVEKLKKAGYDLEIHTWKELSEFYMQVRAMFNMIFGFIFGIVLVVVVMGIANSMSMTVVERTREIGTLRAIGLRRSGVVRLFVGEAALLTMLGCVTGLLITVVVKYAIDAADISYVPPNQSGPVPLLVDLDVRHMLLTTLVMASVGALAAWLPARRAARQPIIDALGHV